MTSPDEPRRVAPSVRRPPVEAPGPSVNPPKFPESDTERQERADATRPDPELLAAQDADEELVAEEESAAAAEAAAVGGVAPRESRDPALDPVYQAGGGVAEGWERAEADLIANAEHAGGGGNPTRDAFYPEAEADRSTAVYGESDRLPSTEVRHDPDAGPDDPMDGDPNLSADRGPTGPLDG
jgi:hypothetical protein